MTAASEAQNGGVTFSQTRPDAGREPPDAGEVPGAHLHRRCGHRDVAGGKGDRGPVEIELVPTGFGVGEAVRMRKQRVVGPGTERQVRRHRVHLDQVGDASTAWEVRVAGHLEDPEHPDLDAQHGAGTGHDVLDVTPPLVLDRERGGRAEQLALGGAQHQGDLATRHVTRR